MLPPPNLCEILLIKGTSASCKHNANINLNLLSNFCIKKQPSASTNPLNHSWKSSSDKEELLLLDNVE